tara:strand:- start:76 stop:582 length:507 start_codon:yes stop_codon:yes gene_type:complete
MQTQSVYVPNVPLDLLLQTNERIELREGCNKSNVIGNYFNAVGIKPEQPRPYLALELLEDTATRQHLDRNEVMDLISTAANGLYDEATRDQDLAGRVSKVIRNNSSALSPGRKLKLARIAIQDELEEAKLTPGRLFAEQFYSAFLADSVEVVSNIGKAVRDLFEKIYK